MERNEPDPNEVLTRLYTVGVESTMFEEAFLERIPLEVVTQRIGRDCAELGALRTIEAKDAGRYRVLFAEGEVELSLALSSAGRISGLFLGPAIRLSDSLEEALGRITALPGEVGLLILRDEAIVAEHQADKKFNVGSAFKLAVLSALARAVEHGAHRWDEVFALREAWRSLPTGILQDWPVGSPLTVATLAGLMIALSDNTATDALIEILGRQAIEAEAPTLAPLLTTREAFLLRSRGCAAQGAEFSGAPVPHRVAIRDSLAGKPLPTASDLLSDGHASTIGWFMSARDLNRIVRSVALLPPMRINTGTLGTGWWDAVAFKGGEMMGAVNITAALLFNQRVRLTIAVTWNDASARPMQLASLALSIVRRMGP